MAIKGYNCYLKVNGTALAGVTSDDLSIAVATKSSVTKSDGGVKKTKATSATVSFKVSGVLDASDNNRLMDLALATGDDAICTIVYVRDTGDQLTGSAVVKGYSESTPADPDSDATWTLDLEVIGTLS